jgi:protein-L-isoaspartate(D-aspartate) O-methyltransferase
VGRARIAGLFLLGIWWLGLACRGPGPCRAGDQPDEAALERARTELVETLRRQGISDERVLAAMGKVPRHRFVPADQIADAYLNRPLSIGLEQTISQPYIVAYMTEALRLAPGQRVLEVGTGSGYQAAVLAEVGAEVYSIEILPELSRRAGQALAQTGHGRVQLKVGDGFDGWPAHAPYDGILVTAAPRQVPAPLVAQLKEGGRLSIPLGEASDQVLWTYQKRGQRLVVVDRLPVRFVPMTGKALR